LCRKFELILGESNELRFVTEDFYLKVFVV
jgi:hypothetical protein